MTTFRPMDIEKDAEEIARLYNFTTNEMLNTDAIIDWWTPREGEIRVTRLAQDELGTAIGYWDIDRET
jgi:hypothetical protein